MPDCKVISLDSRRRQKCDGTPPSSRSALITDGVVDLAAGTAGAEAGKPHQTARLYVLDELCLQDADGAPFGPQGKG